MTICSVINLYSLIGRLKMEISMKKLVVRSMLGLALGIGVASSVSAGQVCDAFGCRYVPICQNVWIQTGPYAGQGYWTTVCN